MSQFQYPSARYDAPPPGSAPTSMPYPIPQVTASQPPPGLQPPGMLGPAGGPPASFSNSPFTPPPGGFPFPVPPVLHPNAALPPVPMPIPAQGGLSRPMQVPIPVPNATTEASQPSDAQPVVPIKSSFLTDSSLRPSTVDEQLRTIFIGSIPAELDDFWLGRLLKAAGPLVGWIRIKDALGKPKEVAMAEYEDTETLGIAVEVLGDMEIPVVEIEEGEEVEDESQADRKEAKLIIKCSDKTNSVLEQQNRESLTETLNAARKAVNDCLEIWKDPVKRSEERENAVTANEEESEDRDAPRVAAGGDDDLTDLPPEQRAVVMKEIAAFRDRANQRERERIKREEETERQRLERIQAEKRRSNAASESPAPPSMPAKMREMSTGYGVDPVAFSKGSTREEDDLTGLGPDAETLSDEALEERRRDKREDELEAKFIERERRYLREERARISNAEREMHHAEDDQKQYTHRREAMLKLLAEWDDDVEEQRRSEEYYRDRSTWLRNRGIFRSREIDADERDAAIERASQPEPEKQLDAAALADSFLQQQAAEFNLQGKREATPSRLSAAETKKEELRRDAGPIRMAFKKEEAPRAAISNKPISIGISQPKAAGIGFKVALGGKKTEAVATKPEKKAFADEDDEVTESKRRKLIPLSYDKMEDGK
ncbi:hypothetical protein V1525DRAFT_448538 [Lipomyces kononenkoae]|uniref:Uncharacterized protein n=1 Tax=Lipomyces kononenkoae TaxID=34357 RepID=A0ACC3T8Q4_LIPKO